MINRKNFCDFVNDKKVNEAQDMNDPVLQWARASKARWDIEKDLNMMRAGKMKSAPKNRLYGKQLKKYELMVSDGEDQIYDIKRDIRDLQSEYRETAEDMEVEAGQIQQSGDEVDDGFANKYGAMLNDIQDNIDKKFAQIDAWQAKVDKWQSMINR